MNRNLSTLHRTSDLDQSATDNADRHRRTQFSDLCAAPLVRGPLGHASEPMPPGRTQFGRLGVLPGGIDSLVTRAPRACQRGGPCLSVADTDPLLILLAS